MICNPDKLPFSPSPVSPAGGVSISPHNAVVGDDVDDITLRCNSEVTLGVRFEWNFNDTLLANETSENLTLSNITASGNGGLYTCFVSNVAGSDSASTYLYFSLVITSGPVDVRASNGSLNATFTCTASAFPIPQFEWYRQGGLLPDTSSVYSNGERSTLTISPVMYGDEGYYYCIVSSVDSFINTSVESNIATLYGKIQTHTCYIPHISPSVQFLQWVVWNSFLKIQFYHMEALWF